MTRGMVLRGLLLGLALALSGVAVWLIVTSTTRRGMEIGVLAGLWAGLIGAFALFGPRRFLHPAELAGEPAASTALEVRDKRAEVERAEQAAERRAYEAHLEQLLRREVRAAVTAEVSALRAEIAQLRSDLLEKVGGQLRLERIETTRVIGSDLEALQHEVRQLKEVAAQEADLALAPRTRSVEAVRQIVEPARVRPVSRQTADVEADVQPARTTPVQDVQPARTTPVQDAQPAPAQAAPASPPAPPAPAAPTTAPTPAPAPAPAPPAATETAPSPAPGVETTGPIRVENADEPAGAPQPRPQPTPAPEPAAGTATPAPRPSPDEFAGLPRISPFTDFDLDAEEQPPVADEAVYTGRRRRASDEEAASVDAEASDEETGRRHRRAAEDGSADDLLARLLARERH